VAPTSNGSSLDESRNVTSATQHDVYKKKLMGCRRSPTSMRGHLFGKPDGEIVGFHSGSDVRPVTTWQIEVKREGAAA
jgi:hypothetical protein